MRHDHSVLSGTVCVYVSERKRERERKTGGEESESSSCIDEQSCKIHGQGKI